MLRDPFSDDFQSRLVLRTNFFTTTGRRRSEEHTSELQSLFPTRRSSDLPPCSQRRRIVATPRPSRFFAPNPRPPASPAIRRNEECVMPAAGGDAARSIQRRFSKSPGSANEFLHYNRPAKIGRAHV